MEAVLAVIILGLVVDIWLATRWRRTVDRQLNNQKIINRNLAGVVLDMKRETPIPLVVRACWSDDEKKTTRFSPVDNDHFAW